jgi:uroporphyrin-3 C-methyltransferase
MQSQISDKHPNKTLRILIILLVLLVIGGGVIWHTQAIVLIGRGAYHQMLQENRQHFASVEQAQQQLQTQQNQLREQLTNLLNEHSPSELNEIIYLLEQAKYNLILQQNLPTAQSLLQLAERRTTRINSIEFDRLGKAIAQDLKTITTIKAIDTESLIHYFADVTTTLNKMTLLPEPVVKPPETVQKPATSWREPFVKSVASLRDVIVIQRTEQLYTPILTAEELALFKQYLQSILQQALWAGLQGNSIAYETSLNVAITALSQKLTLGDPLGAQIKTKIEALQKINVAPYAKVNFVALPLAEQLLQKTASGNL